MPSYINILQCQIDGNRQVRLMQLMVTHKVHFDSTPKLGLRNTIAGNTQ